ncbi:nuclease-related domain-containing protein [Paenibacillus dakarensis]|uniref:nuclease-related domain-containing protein n=1 Tax=Paenibacillus dakarensis TaxID=1527293 RepID=UPI0006D58CFB|nr:nuclease-related domain-containing protein [Paenibacillus dakarensis]
MLEKILSLFKPKPKPSTEPRKTKKTQTRPKIESTRIGELGEHKINIQLDQLPKDCRYLSDLLVSNPKSRSGYSQIDHLVISPYGLFVIETKNYNGEIKGGRSDKQWSVSNRFKMYNPFMQNYGHIKAIERHIGQRDGLRYISMISFTMRCRFSVDPDLRKIQSDELIVYDVELSEFIQRKINMLKMSGDYVQLTGEDIQQIYQKLSAANITDPAIRAAHADKVKERKTP